MTGIGEDDGGECVVKVVGPLGIHARAFGLDGGDDVWVVQVGLGDQDEAATEGGREIVHVGGELFEEVNSGAIDDFVNRIKPEAVDVEVFHPHQGVIEEEAADFVGAAILEVDGDSPRGAVFWCGVWPELSGVIADRSEVVVDDVKNDGDTVEVAGIDETLHGFGAAVVTGDGEEIHAIVAPAAVSGKFRDWHDFHVSDTEMVEVLQTINRAVEGAFGGEGAYM